MSMRMRDAHCDAANANRLAADFGWILGYARAVDWELESSVSVALLDY
jgi:hypothetical protein